MIEGMRPPGSPKQLEKRRLYAIKLRQSGKSLTDVARRTGVDRRSITRWQRRYRAQGRVGLQARPIPGRPVKLSRRQLQQLRCFLLKGALAYGFSADYWTLQRVKALIWKQFRVRYTPSALWYLLARFEWSCQEPQPRASQRDESEIARWKRSVWPQIKKRMGTPRTPCFYGRKWLLLDPASASHLGPQRPDSDHPLESQPGESECHRHPHCFAPLSPSLDPRPFAF